MNSLFLRSVAALLGILVCIGLATVGITWWTTERYQQEVTQRLNKTIADYVVATQNLMEEDRINENALKDIAHMVMIINPSIEVYLLDPKGQVVGHALPEGAVADQPIALEPVKRFIANPDRLPVYGDDPRNPQAQKVFSAAPVMNDAGDVTGYLYAVLGGEAHMASVRGLRNSLIIKNGVVAVMAIMCFALLAGLLIFYLLTRRLHRLVGSFNAFRDNGFSEVVNADHRAGSHDEIDTLAVTFNRMSRKIVEQMYELRQTDRRRRELMQNVSHDLRTPLASMQGYIDTLYLKYDELSESQRREYLETAGRHGEHLSKLVKELFELSNLDAGILKIKEESFSMAELVQDIVQKFKLDAARRGVTLEIDIEKTAALVSADIGMLERVLENLIDNALKHTDSNGMVRVCLKKHENRVVTTVFDSGAGISSEDLPRIFERTFVSSNGDPNRQRGTGLGLAIVKKILDLHNSKIEVASKLGQGSAFSFALKCA
ncbi:MAG: sensor histidine kinase [Pseudomonadota bacterium]